MGEIIRFPLGADTTWEDIEEVLQGYLNEIFHSKEKRDHIIARMKEYYEIPAKLQWEVTFKNLYLFPVEQQEGIMEAFRESADGDLRDAMVEIMRPIVLQGFENLLKKEIDLQLKDQR